MDEVNVTQPEQPDQGGEGVPTPPPPEPAVPPPPLEPSVIATRSKADLGKRFFAALIDGALAGIVSFVPVIGGLIGAAYMLVRDGLDVDFMDGRSIGKKIMKLRPVRISGEMMDIGTSVKRNLPFAIGPVIMIIPILGWLVGPVVALAIGLVEAILVLTDAEGRRVGDKLAETMVVEVDE